VPVPPRAPSTPPILKPMLARGELQTIGATTLDEYRKHLEKDAALERRFQPVKVEEPTVAHTIEILKGLRDKYEAHHRVTITDQALVAAANLADRYISDRHLPDKAIDLIDEAGSRLRIKRMADPAGLQGDRERSSPRCRRQEEGSGRGAALRRGRSPARPGEGLLEEKDAKEAEIKASGVDLFDEVDEEAIAEVLSAVDRHPGVQAHRGGDRQAPQHGGRAPQAGHRPGEAIKAVSQAIRRTRAGLKDPKRPAARSSSWAPRAWARPSWPRRSPSSCSATRTA
jgi:ATP-dependent Clp protease ATP-binding subunit ClpC